MRKLAILLALLAACDSKAETPKASDTPKGGEPAPATNAPDKPAPKDGDFLKSDMYVDPPAELVSSLGVEPYPGAKVFKSLTGVKKGDAYRDVMFFTTDSAAKVGEFYKTKLKNAKPVAAELQNENLCVLDGQNEKGDKVRIQAQSQKGRTHIHVVTQKK
jgi:hypothetical protein